MVERGPEGSAEMQIMLDVSPSSSWAWQNSPAPPAVRRLQDPPSSARGPDPNVRFWRDADDRSRLLGASGAVDSVASAAGAGVIALFPG